MKIVYYSQNPCSWCVRLKPHLKAAAQKVGLEVEEIDITGKWEIAQQIGFRSTPAVYIDDYGILTEITERTTIPLIRELEQYV